MLALHIINFTKKNCEKKWKSLEIKCLSSKTQCFKNGMLNLTTIF